eukprot:5194540-Amphidinium_carterae.1
MALICVAIAVHGHFVLQKKGLPTKINNRELQPAKTLKMRMNAPSADESPSQHAHVSACCGLL